MRNGGIIQTALTKNLPLELDYRPPSVAVEFCEISGYIPTPLEYATPELCDEFHLLLSTL